ncbi:geranylgeranyl transferase type-2 subunit alpha-like [Glandiceps talaboti]
MHGRIKVKTTAEQKEAKRKEREKKLKLYNAATEKAFEKRANKEYDDEALELTGQMLNANSDFSTMWNYRKEIFVDYKDKKTAEEMEKIFKNELHFLEICLQQNPKSYGVWHHRCFIMDTMPNADWKRELELCNKFLEYDERNFHCWDYRRFVVQRSNVAVEAEVEYTNTKISSNFSNFSSWHYRSKLLPILYPDPTKKERVKEDILHQEYELVQNAFFTDPNDQSAWFYHRWLLGRAEQAQDIRYMYINKKMERLVVSLTIAMNLEKEESEIKVNDQVVKATWFTPNKQRYSSLVWICQLPEGTMCQAQVNNINVSIDGGRIQKTVVLKGEVCCHGDTVTPQTVFTSEMSAETSTVLQNELESCQQLQELEPENKWCLLTILFLMRALNPLKYEQLTLEYLDLLKKVDSYRMKYYNDLRSKFVIENTISRIATSDVTSIDLSNKGLTCLYHANHLICMTDVNLSSNQLSSLRHCYMLQGIQKLEADDNKINDLSDVVFLPQLQTLSIQNNCLTVIEQLSPLSSCAGLTTLQLQGNSVCDIPDFKVKVQACLPQLKQLNGEDL